MNTICLKFRTHFLSTRITMPLYIAFAILFVVVYIFHFPQSGLIDNSTVIHFMSMFVSLLAVVFIPLLTGRVLSDCELTQDGVVEKRRYLWGTISLSHLTLWKDVMSWNNSYKSTPVKHIQISQIIIYCRSHSLRIDNKLNHYYSNSKQIDWDSFQKDFISMMNSIGIPKVTPVSIFFRPMTIKITIASLATLVALSIITGAFISFTTGKISFVYIFAATVFFLLFSGLLTKLLKNK